MIIYRSFEELVRQRLDSDISEIGDADSFYSTSVDILPAFNAACISLTRLLSVLLEQSKVPSEALSELRVYKTFISSALSTVRVEDVMFIEGVYPFPDLPKPVIEYKGKSVEVSSENEAPSLPYSASYLTAERESLVHQNPFANGYTKQKCIKDKVSKGEFVTFAYTAPFKAKDGIEIKVFPNISGELCTVKCISNIKLLNIDQVEADDYNTEVPLPQSLLEYLVEKALFYISYKQGDGDSIGELADSEITKIMQTLI